MRVEDVGPLNQFSQLPYFFELAGCHFGSSELNRQRILRLEAVLLAVVQNEVRVCSLGVF